MFTIKQVTQDDEFACGKNTQLFQAQNVAVFYHCDPSFNTLVGEGVSKDVSAVVIADDKQITVVKGVTVYIVNENGKTVQTV